MKHPFTSPLSLGPSRFAQQNELSDKAQQLLKDLPGQAGPSQQGWPKLMLQFRA